MSKTDRRRAGESAGETARMRLTFADGLRYFVALYAPLLEGDPVLLNQALSLIETAEREKAVPRRVQPSNRSAPVPWFEEYALVDQRFRNSGGVTVAVTPRGRGRPRNDDLETV